MKMMGTVVAVLALSGCAGMQQVKPNERFLQTSFAGKTFMEFEYETGEACAAEVAVMTNAMKGAVKRCASVSDMPASAPHFPAVLAVYGKATVRVLTPQMCEKIRKSLIENPDMSANTFGECK